MFILLAAAFLLLGSFSNAFRFTRPAWRFQLFYLDFTLGFAALALLAAFTVGSETDLTFGDRLLVAGRLKEAQVIAAAVLADLGFMLLFAAASAIGLARILPLAFSTALLIPAGSQLTSARSMQALLLGVGVAFCVIAAITSWPSNVIDTEKRTSYKFAVLALMGGVCIGSAMFLTSGNIAGEFGMGPYAAITLYGATSLIVTPVLTIYFMNLPVEGGRVSFADYRLGTWKQHAIGFAGGLACAGGLLAAFLAADRLEASNRSALFAGTNLSAVLTIIYGLLWWKESADVKPQTKRMLFASIAALSIAILVLAFSEA